MNINETYLRLKKNIESLQPNESRLEMMADLETMKKSIMTNPVSHQHNAIKRDIDLPLIQENRGNNDRLYVAMLDIDNFGKFNKLYGEHIGNKVLECTGQIMHDSLRKDDIVAGLVNDAYNYHLHGEEKLMIYNCDNDKDAYHVADKVRKNIEAETQSRIGYSVTESIGVTEWTPATESYLAAQERADLNMQIAKMNGKNQIYMK